MQQAMTVKAGGANRRVLILALVLGAIAIGLVVAYLASLDTGAKAATVPTVKVVVASQDITAGTKIADSMVEMKAIPQTAVVPDAFTGAGQAVGQVARYPIASGEQVGPSRLIAPAKGQNVSFQIPSGLRGFTVPVSVSNSPAALLAPGDFVDVIVEGQMGVLYQTVTPQQAQAMSGINVSLATTLLQNVQVLAVQNDFVNTGVPYDSSVRGTPPENKSITYVMLAVTPEQAQLLWISVQDAKLTLSLRGFGDDAIVAVDYSAEPLHK